MLLSDLFDNRVTMEVGSIRAEGRVCRNNDSVLAAEIDEFLLRTGPSETLSERTKR
jgi:hypothetical protein